MKYLALTIRKQTARLAELKYTGNSPENDGYEMFSSPAGFDGISELFNSKEFNPFEKLKQKMKAEGYNDFYLVISAPMSTIREQAMLYSLATKGGFTRIRFLSSVEAAATGLNHRMNTGIHEHFLDDGISHVVIWNDLDTVEMCQIDVGDEYSEFFYYSGARITDQEQTPDVLKHLLDSIIEFPQLHGNLHGKIYFKNDLPERVGGFIREYAKIHGLTAVQYGDYEDLAGTLYMTAVLSGLKFADCTIVLMSGYEFHLLKNNQKSQLLFTGDSAIPGLGTWPKDNEQMLYMREITDNNGHVTILVSKPFHPEESIEIKLPVYEIWNGKNMSDTAKVTIDIDANHLCSISVANLSNQRAVTLSWNDICEQLLST